MKIEMDERTHDAITGFLIVVVIVCALLVCQPKCAHAQTLESQVVETNQTKDCDTLAIVIDTTTMGDTIYWNGVEILDSVQTRKQGARIWDCDDTSALDSAEAHADFIDRAEWEKIDSLTKSIMAKHRGHQVEVSMAQNLVYNGPTCMSCDVCGHFDIPNFYPVERIEVWCGDKVWRIRR